MHPIVQGSLTWGTLGVGLHWLPEEAHDDHARHGDELRTVHEALDFVVPGMSTGLPWLLWQADLPSRLAEVRRQRRREDFLAREDFSPQREEGALHKALGSRGWARIDSWAAYDLNFHKLKQQALRALGRSGSAGSAQRSYAPLPALTPLLSNHALAAAIHSYLGGPARYDGSVVLHLTDRVSIENYVSGQWHHDRCGRRLKLFIFLHDVDMDGRPTCVADASHNPFYYTHGEPWRLLSRFKDDWVRAHYNETCMTGRAGGGFIFDTNSLHRGRVEGVRPRTAVLLEFHQHNKVVPLKRVGIGNPCPSYWPKNFISKAARQESLRGKYGFPLYPQELNTSRRL